MNLFAKHKPWMIASLLATTPLFAQNQSCNPKAQNQVCKPAKCGVPQAPMQPTIAAYNAPAEIDVGMQGELNFFVAGAFLYLQPLQDNMQIATIYDSAITGSSVTGFLQGATAGTTAHANTLEMDYKYKPGFQVMLGMNLQDDDWVGYGEYTRVHGTHTSSSNGASGGGSIISDNTMSGEVFGTVSSDFTCNFDAVDAILERVYYVGQNLVFQSAFGARGAWLKESFINTFGDGVGTTPGTSSNYTIRTNNKHVVQRTHSWGVGPRAGLEMDWNLGDGVRFFGTTFLDVLYTKYKVQNKATFNETVTNASTGITTTKAVSMANKDIVKALRTHVDTEMGFGWGMYFDNNAWHIDLSASYGFQVFFNQNMFTTDINHPDYKGNLYMHGLTTTARFDF